MNTVQTQKSFCHCLRYRTGLWWSNTVNINGQVFSQHKTKRQTKAYYSAANSSWTDKPSPLQHERLCSRTTRFPLAGWFCSSASHSVTGSQTSLAALAQRYQQSYQMWATTSVLPTLLVRVAPQWGGGWSRDEADTSHFIQQVVVSWHYVTATLAFQRAEPRNTELGS